MRILISGGSGYLGTHLRSFFDADDLSRRSGLDILNLQDAQMAADYDVVVHLAASMDKSHDSAEEVFLTNVDGTVNLLRVMRKDAVFIFASTKDVYGRFADNFREVPETCPTLYSGQSPLEWSKLVAEHYVDYYSHLRNFRSCIFRLSTVYAPATEGNTPGFVGHYADCLDQGKPIRLPGAGRPVRDLLHVDDFAKACKAFIDSIIRHGTYNLGGGPKNATSLSNLVEMLESSSGFQAVHGAPLPDPLPFNYVSDIGRVMQELDWSPEIDNETGLRTLFNAGAESEAAAQ
ncbi:MAG: NAD-dependent epimerase/dehydratase family protein [Acidobacteria bacterium]|nr:NAD-dependent epimerase/dehydratase family protein [Acidobacteriota bacterium]